MLRGCTFSVGVKKVKKVNVVVELWKKAPPEVCRTLDLDNKECTDYHEALSFMFYTRTVANEATKTLINVQT